MKLASFKVASPLGTAGRLGVVEGEEIIDANAAYRAYLSESENNLRAATIADAVLPPNMRGYLEGGKTSQEALGQALAYVHGSKVSRGVDGQKIIYRVGEVEAAPVISDPPMIVDFYSFETHVKHAFEMRNEPIPQIWYEIPVAYKKNPASTSGDGQDILWPKYTEQMDYEMEVAVIIGKKGKNIPKEEAESYIAGYTIFNDFSARDIQLREMELRLGPFKGKDFDTSAALGPYLVTPDEIPDFYNLKIEVRVDGEVRCNSNTGDLYHRFPAMISYASQEETLYPGDVLGSGTAGYGCGLELGRFLNPGEVVELEVESLGVLRNRVVRA
jgi:2-keto-4-pentenoate hydratase/2-oxohepta-3-ene-1,7-dioic acid hydratase in catechol pathway